MPRHARLHAPGAIVHVIARIVNREFRIIGTKERAELLERLASALVRTDWQLIAYALMSNHYHLVLVAGHAPPWQIFKPFHTSAAGWLNRTQRRFGPVFAERATTLLVPSEHTGRLIAYVHNNPVRARVARDPTDTEWTSHRAYLGLAPPPARLDVETGLRLSGFTGTAAGQDLFHSLVCERMLDPWGTEWSGTRMRQLRCKVRAEVALPVEVASPYLDDRGALKAAVLHLGETAVVPRWPGKLERLIQRVCEARGIGREALCSRERLPRTVDARRLALTVGARLLRRNVNEVAAALGIADSTASMLLRQADQVIDEAVSIATALRAEIVVPAREPGSGDFLGS